MADTLFFRRTIDGLEWLSFSPLGQIELQGAGTEAEFRAAVAPGNFDGQAICVVPGEDVLLTRASVPSKQYRQILQAVPYVVEELLATDVEDCFFALGERSPNGEVPVAVVADETIIEWVEQLGTFDLDVRNMVSECNLVTASSPVGVVLDGDRAHVGLSNGSGTTTQIKELPLVVSTIEDVESVDLWVSADQAGAVDLQVSELRTGEAEINLTSGDETAFEQLCRCYDGSEINLLQGQFKVAEVRSGSSSIWRSVAVLTICAVSLHLMTLVGQGLYLANEADGFQTEAMSIYSKAFPQDKNVRDIRRRWNSHLGKREATDNVFISLLAQSSKNLSAAGLTLNNVNFNESRGDLILQVIGQRSEELVQYSQRLTDQGMDAEIGTITQEGDGVRGSIKIRAGGGPS